MRQAIGHGLVVLALILVVSAYGERERRLEHAPAAPGTSRHRLNTYERSLLCGGFAIGAAGLICAAPWGDRWPRRRRKLLKCRYCGYDLTGVYPYRCPECGKLPPSS